MLRHAVLVGKPSASAVRRCLAAAATAQQKKRALNPEQIRGGAAGPPKPPLGVQPPPPPPPSNALKMPPPTSGGGGGNSNLLPLGVVGILVAGGSYYYYSTMEQTAETPPMIQIADKEEKRAAAGDAAAADSKAPKDAAQKDAPKSSSTLPLSEPYPSAGNRVLSIAVPSKMKNSESSTAAVTPPAHPASGNRVSDLLVSRAKATAASSDSPPPPIDDTSMTVSAVKALQDSTTLAATEAVLQSHQSLWTAMDESFFADLDRLTVSQLKARVMQLATELKDRTKWEAVRLKEFLAMKEKETADKYLEILQKQRLEFEDILAKRLREQDNELSTRLYKSLQEKEATIQSVLSTALEAQQNEHEADKKAFEEIITGEIQSALDEEYGKRLEEYKSQVAQDLQQKVATLNALTQKLQHLEAALEAGKTSKEGSHKAHRLSAAALALAEKLETNGSAASELSILKLAAGNVGVISTACATIPAAVKTGVPTLPELQTRFEKAYKKGRQAALVPAGRPGLEGQLAGLLFASLKFPPNADDPAPDADKDSAEYVLVRAQKHVQLGELEQAVEQLDKLTSQPAFTLADWKRDAINRIAVEKALKVIKMECALLNESCLEEE